MRKSSYWLLSSILLVACGDDHRPGEVRARAAAVAVASPVRVVHRDFVASLGAVVTARGDDGRPTMVRAIDVAPSGASQAIAAAQAFVTRFAPMWGGTTGVLVPTEAMPLARGLVVVGFEARHVGRPIVGSTVRVMMREDLSLVSITGAPPTNALGAQDVLVSADAARDAAVRRALGARGVAREPHARLVLALRDGRLVPAYRVSVFGTRDGGTDGEGFRVTIDARDGSVLESVSVTQHDAFTYRAFADTTSPFTPFEGPQASFLPHPTGLPDGVEPAFVAPNLVTVEGLITSLAAPDPWLPSGAIESTGNNVDAYSDSAAPDGFTAGTDFRAAVTSPGMFDRTYDPALDALVSPAQQAAGVTQLFFTINWLHDYFYDSGFTEVAGNAQADVYGRGGVGGDAMLAEAQDDAIAGTRDNANMSPFEDGTPPVMQIYVWNGVETRTLEFAPTLGTSETTSAAFGATSFDVTATLALANDGTSATSDACEPITNNVAGQIVLVDRGACDFQTKAASVQAAGGLGMIVVNNVAGNTPSPLGGSDPSITIGLLGVGQDAGNAAKAALMLGPVTVRMARVVGPLRDGAVDSTLVAHEWGHYLHRRLAGTGGSAQDAALSEGWADFVALHMALRDGDSVDGVFPLTVYVAGGTPNGAYFGIRRAPYSHDRTKNDFSFRHIADGEALPTHPLNPASQENSESHNAGEIWTSMLFEGFRELALAHGNAEARRRMADYVVAGMLVTPFDATFVEARDGLLTAVLAVDADDFGRLHGGFASRGLGACAVGPARNSTDFAGIVESVETGAYFEVQSVALVDDGVSCDTDGVLDAGESGHLEVHVVNLGGAPGTPAVTASTPNAELVLGSPDAGVSLAPFESVVVRFPAMLANTQTTTTVLETSVSVGNPAACSDEPLVGYFLANADDLPAMSTTADFDSELSGFTTTGTPTFTRVLDPTSRETGFRATYEGNLEETLESPSLSVGSGPFTIAFEHRYAFEQDMTTGLGFDGGALEITVDDGATWVDVTTYVASPYTGTMFDDDSTAPSLRNRAAFVGTSAGYPATETITLDFGTLLANQTVRFRFLFGTDPLTSDFGWEIRSFTATGIAGTPFGLIVADGVCGDPPDAGALDAGTDAAEADAQPQGDAGTVGHRGESGCGCSTAGQPARGAASLPVVAALLLAWARASITARRRRTRAAPRAR